MGLLDDAKAKFEELKGEHGDKVEDASDQGVEKAGDLADDKTGGKYTEHIDTAQQKADDAI